VLPKLAPQTPPGIPTILWLFDPFFRALNFLGLFPPEYPMKPQSSKIKPVDKFVN
jgi:hypothetical protein